MENITEIEKLRFPIGKFVKPEKISTKQINDWINEIELFPDRIKKITNELSANELNWQYRKNGWTIKQIVHHCADSFMNSFIRFKLAVTEDTPTIKPYFEDRWAELPDTLEADISESIKLLEGLHKRWVNLLRSLTGKELKKEFIHPEYNKRISVEENIRIYAWHANHHLAHIKLALNTKGNLNN